MEHWSASADDAPRRRIDEARSRRARQAHADQWVVLRPRRNGRGAGARTGRARSGDRVGPSVEVAGKTADVAMSDAARRIDGQIAGAAIGAAIGSAGRGRAAPHTAVRHASARDRHGRGTRIQCPVSLLVARLAGACCAQRGIATLVRSLTVRIMRTGARLLFPVRSDGGSGLGSTDGSPLRNP